MSILFISFLFVSNVLSDPYVWPLPYQYTISDTPNVAIAADFAITTTSSSTILKNGIQRYMDIIFMSQPMTTAPSNAIKSVVVTTKSDDETLQYGVDESYTLELGGTSNVINSNTVYGALRGLETLSQLIIFNSTLGYYSAYTSSINDKPRFDWRGVLIDTSRHFQSVRSILRVVQSMSFAKLNVLHWHIV